MSWSIGEDFANHFFKNFDQKNYAVLAKLFRPKSILSFENINRLGTENIVKLFQTFNRKYPLTQHKQTADTLPAPYAKLVFINGRRLDKEHPNIMTGVLFSCTVILKKDSDGAFISNMIYRGESNGQNLLQSDLKTGAHYDLKIGFQFVQHFYKQYDSNVRNLAGVYSDCTFLKYEKDDLKGVEWIMRKLIPGASEQFEKQHKKKLKFRSVTFKTVKHAVEQVNVHPLDNYLLVTAAGRLAPDGSTKPVKFAEVFILQNILKNAKGWKVAVQGFRMIY